MIVKVNIPSVLLQKLDELAAKMHRSRASLIRQYVQAYLREPEPLTTSATVSSVEVLEVSA